MCGWVQEDGGSKDLGSCRIRRSSPQTGHDNRAVKGGQRAAFIEVYANDGGAPATQSEMDGERGVELGRQGDGSSGCRRGHGKACRWLVSVCERHHQQTSFGNINTASGNTAGDAG
jgi:hypothetical protein